MKEQRSEERNLCADLVEIHWKDSSGRNRQATANLEDISPSGLCLQVDVPIPVYSEVRITYPSGEYTGVVRYCQFKEIGHYVGVQFEPGCRWSKTEYNPLHLLDLGELE
ncbi:MAG: PilZ domain-containing protein [Bryobacterales bacterium]|nr:PilZ domain-containing protein [Bryobacterales bacterium]